MENIKTNHRIIYDQDGEVVTVLYGMEGSVKPLKEISKLEFLEIEYDNLNPLEDIIKGVDLKTKTLILEKIPVQETEEQKRIRELEDTLLIELENELGGII